jgi:hypothetical protein
MTCGISKFCNTDKNLAINIYSEIFFAQLNWVIHFEIYYALVEFCVLFHNSKNGNADDADFLS